MNTPPRRGIFLPDEEENAGIAALCRGFLTKYDGKRTAVARDVNKLEVPSPKVPLKEWRDDQEDEEQPE